MELHLVERIAPNEEDGKMHRQETRQDRAGPNSVRDRPEGAETQRSGAKTLKDAVKLNSKRKKNALSGVLSISEASVKFS